MKFNRAIMHVFLLIIFFGSNINVTFGFDRGDVDIHGFVSQGYLRSSDNNYLGNSKDGSFQFNEIGISFSALLTDDLRFGAQVFSRDLGDYGNNDLIVDWASLDYLFKDWLGFRAGKIKTPYGLYNRKRDADMLRTSVLMPQGVYNEGLRDLVLSFYGAGLYGNVNLNAFGFLDYEIYGGTLDVPPGTPFIKGYLEQMNYSNRILYNMIIAMGETPETVEIKIDHIEGGMLNWNTPLSGLRFSATDLIGKGAFSLGPEAMDYTIAQFSVFSVEYEVSNITFAAEYMKVDIDIDPSSILPMLTAFGLTPPSEAPALEGYYGAVSWDAAKWLTLGAGYGEYYPDASDKDGEVLESMGLQDFWAWQKDITLSVRFNLSEYFCVKLETHFNNGLGLTSLNANDSNLTDNQPPSDVKKDWILYTIKSSLNF